jgi:hypothetical protein
MAELEEALPLAGAAARMGAGALARGAAGAASSAAGLAADAVTGVVDALDTDDDDLELSEDAGHSILDVITPEELEELRGYVNDTLDSRDFLGSDVYEKLFEYYLNSGEMPYGIAKARTGEPDYWILDRVQQDYADEVCTMDEGSEASRGRAAEREWVADMADRARGRGDVEVSRGRSGEDYFTFMGRKQDKPAPAKKRRFAFGFGEGVNESNNKQNGETKMKEGYIKQLRKLLEAEVEQAESIIAARGFSQELQDMVEKLGRLVNEDLPAVSEQMRDAYGADVATGFENAVGETLSSVMDSLKSSKQDIDNSVSAIADGQAPQAGTGMDDVDFDAEDELELDGEMGGELGDEMGDEGELDLDGDELDLDDMGDEGEGELLGRAKKESVDRKLQLKKQIVEMKQKLAKIKAKRSK